VTEGRRARAVGRRELALALAAFGFSLVVLELGTRLLLPPTRYHDAPVEFDPELGFDGVPNLRFDVERPDGSHEFALNADGLRGRALPTEAPGPGVSRIAFLGDSFLVGVVVPEENLMTSRLEAALRAEGQQAEVYNLSVVDFGTAQQLLLLDRVAEVLQPEVVVLALYTGNDIVNNALPLAGTTQVSPGDSIRPYLVPDDGELRATWAVPWRGRLRSVSRLFTVIERRWLSQRLPGSANAEVPARARLQAGRAPREQLEVFRDHPTGHSWELAWDTTFALLRALRDRCDALGARLFVLLIPNAYQVERAAKAVRFQVEARAFSGQALDALLDWNLPEKRLAAFLEAEGIDALSLLMPFREASRERPVYEVDQHLNSLGHEIAFEQLRERLATRGPSHVGDVEGAPVHALHTRHGEITRLDFREHRHDRALGFGWIEWQAFRDDGEGGDGDLDWGWHIGPSALLAIRAQPGALVVRGTLPSEARLPVAGRLAFVGGRTVGFALTRHGPFELRLPLRSRPVVDDQGYAAVLIGPGQTHIREGFPIGFVVREVGFESEPR